MEQAQADTPLSESTRQRIARGADKFALNGESPLIVQHAELGDCRVEAMDVRTSADTQRRQETPRG
jgi:hypothetical protein